jgi:hypothetical protein
MIRIVAENILLFLLPTVIYIAYVYMTREEKPGATRVLDDAPLIWLFVAGAALVIATLVIFGSISGGKPGQVYVPSVLKDGRIEPGRIE